MNCDAQTKPMDAQDRSQRPVFQPRIDLWETPTDWNLVAELPGVRPEDLEIVTKEGTLTLEGRVHDRVVENAKLRRSEYGIGDFRRTFHLGESLAADGAEATLKDGVLTLRLPKHESVLPKKIQVRQG
jgi:HSP20 family molecular chaperone IbpA